MTPWLFANKFVYPWAYQQRTSPLHPWVTVSVWPTIEEAAEAQKAGNWRMGRLLMHRVVAR